MNLSPQKQYLVELYQDGEWKCSTAIEFVRDFRKRFSEMRREGFSIDSKPCDGRCGVKHASTIHMYRLDAPVEPPKPVHLVKHPFEDRLISTEEYALL